jgi:hypothetical protein
MSNTPTGLPEEIKKEINEAARHYANVEVCDWGKITVPAVAVQWEQAHEDFRAGATAYAPYKVMYEQAKNILKVIAYCNESETPIDSTIHNEIKKFLLSK